MSLDFYMLYLTILLKQLKPITKGQMSESISCNHSCFFRHVSTHFASYCHT